MVKFTEWDKQGLKKLVGLSLSLSLSLPLTRKDIIQDVNVVDSRLEQRGVLRSTMRLKQGASLNTAAEFATALPLAVKQILIS